MTKTQTYKHIHTFAHIKYAGIAHISIHIHTYTHTHIHTFTYIDRIFYYPLSYIHTQTHTHIHTYIHTDSIIPSPRSIHTHTHTYIHTHLTTRFPAIHAPTITSRAKSSTSVCVAAGPCSIRPLRFIPLNRWFLMHICFGASIHRRACSIRRVFLLWFLIPRHGRCPSICLFFFSVLGGI